MKLRALTRRALAACLVFGGVSVALSVPSSAHPLVPAIGPGSTNRQGTICVQSALNYVAGQNLPADGDYGPATAQAVWNLQAYFGIPATGVVDSHTGGVLGYFVDLRGGSGTWRDAWSCYWNVPSEDWPPPSEGPFPYHLPLPFESLPRDAWDNPHHDYPAVDLIVRTGTPVFAMTSGTTYSNSGGTCGGHVRLEGIDAVRYSYCHLSRVLIGNGQYVERGQLIGYSGATGNASGPHLHLEINSWSMKRCPGPMLLALYDNYQPYAPSALPTTGCFY